MNEIVLTPAAIPADIEQRIRNALERHAEVEANRIRVSVHDGGKVSIEGDVDNWEERRIVERAAWSTPGVRVVEDHLRIS